MIIMDNNLEIVTKLEDMKPKEKCKVIKVNATGAIKRRIQDMGLVRGTIIEIERVAPLGDPIEIKVRSYHLSLRKDEAKAILVEKI